MVTAFLSGIVKSTVQDIGPKGDLKTQLSFMICKINELIYHSQVRSDNKRLLTMNILALDLQNGQGYLLNCGHHNIYHLHKGKLMLFCPR